MHVVDVAGNIRQALLAGLFAIVSFFWTYPMYLEYTGGVVQVETRVESA